MQFSFLLLNFPTLERLPNFFKPFGFFILFEFSPKPNNIMSKIASLVCYSFWRFRRNTKKEAHRRMKNGVNRSGLKKVWAHKLILVIHSC